MSNIFSTRAIRREAQAAAVLAGAMPANAAVTAYNTRAAFEAAAGMTAIQDFNNYVVDTSYRSAPIDVAGQFTISGTNLSTSANENYIGRSPWRYDGAIVDGTPYIRALLQPGSTIFFNFAQPITAFGADFHNMINPSTDLTHRTAITVSGSTFCPTIAAGICFWGVVSDTPFSEVRFEGIDDDLFGIDNVTFSTPVSGVVTALATWAKMIGGFGLVGTAARQQRLGRAA